MIERLARAKVNLALHVTGERQDGYHEIDTIVGFADSGDRITVEPAPAGEIRFSFCGPFAADLPQAAGDNIVARAAHALQDAARRHGSGGFGAAIALEKNLPVASGLGGGSADAAAVLLALRQMWRLPDGFDLAALAVTLGADVPMCLQSAPLRARGIGERTEPLDGARPLPALLVNPRVALSTPAVFAALRQKENAPIGPFGDDPFDPAFLAKLRNDLEAPARSLAPAVGEVIALLGRQQGCLLARMSGSGATCFGLFADAEAAAAAHRHFIDRAPQWWSVPTRIGGSRDGAAQ